MIPHERGVSLISDIENMAMKQVYTFPMIKMSDGIRTYLEDLSGRGIT